jgi:hypothetical protein
METIGFGTGAAGDAASVIGATDSDEDIDSDERLDITVDELELESGAELSVVVPAEVSASVPVEDPTFPYL